MTGTLGGSSGEGPETGKLLSAFKLSYAQKSVVQKNQGFIAGEEAGLMGQLTDAVNGTPELSGWSTIETMKTVPATWGLG
jgi:hypothetical protein